jgi:hypothetical protein
MAVNNPDAKLIQSIRRDAGLPRAADHADTLVAMAARSFA